MRRAVDARGTGLGPRTTSRASALGRTSPARCAGTIEGRERAESVRFRHRGRERSIRASLVLLHEGVIPNAHLTLAAQLDHVWDARQHAFRPAADEWGRTSEPGVLVAGDGARILGAEAAVETGRIAALEAVYRLGRIRVQQRDVLAKPHRASLARHRRFREFLDLTFEPGPTARRPSDPAVTVCRCEEVTVMEIAVCDWARMSGPQSGQGVHPLRYGTLPGSDVRDLSERDVRRAPACRRRDGGTLPHSSAGEARHRG